MRNIHFRCAKCQATTKAQVSAHPGTFAKVACSSCAGTFLLEAEPLGDVSDEEYSARVRDYATAQNIDLPSACSVLEGIMLRESVRALPIQVAATPRANVTDRSVSRGSFALGVLVVGCVFFAGRSMGGRSTAPSAAKAAPTLMSAGPALPPLQPAGKSGWITCQIDEAGALIRLSGPDPRTVFDALLDRPEYGGNLIPYGFSPSSIEGVEAKVGVARDRMDPSQLYSVRLWTDRQGHWMVGDGRNPVRIASISLPPEGFQPF